MNCKSVVFALALASLATAPALAQRSAVTNAIMEQRAGRLDKARTEIDKAAVDERTGAEAKTWFTRGEIYEGLMTNPLYKKTAPANSAQLAYESFQKSIELDAKGKEYAPQAKEHMNALYGLAFNAGVAAYNEKQYADAIAQYQLAAKIKPQDTTAVLYTAYANEAMQNTQGASDAYRNVLTMGHKTQQIYGRLLALAQSKPDQEQLDLTREALTAYPNSMPFMLQEISLMLKMGKEQEAITKIQNAITADPKNSNLYAVLGSLYDKMGKPDDAVKVYEKAVEADPTNYDAQFNLGVYQFNKGAELINKTRKMSPQEYTKQNGKKIEADAKGYFEKSVPYFEAALRIKGCDKGALASLQKAYVTLNKLPDAERIQKQSDDCAAKK